MKRNRKEQKGKGKKNHLQLLLYFCRSSTTAQLQNDQHEICDEAVPARLKNLSDVFKTKVSKKPPCSSLHSYLHSHLRYHVSKSISNSEFREVRKT